MNMSIEELKTKTVMELKSYAKKNDIDLYGVSTKMEILEVIASFIPPVQPPEPEKKFEEAEDEELIVSDKAVLFATHNLVWEGLGKLAQGYNLVPKETAGQWLRHKSVRSATARELARSYGK